MTNLNVSFEGYAERVIENMIKSGYAKTKAEALRLALFEFDQRHDIIAEEKLFAEAAKTMLDEIKAGREKTSKFSIDELD